MTSSSHSSSHSNAPEDRSISSEETQPSPSSGANGEERTSDPVESSSDGESLRKEREEEAKVKDLEAGDSSSSDAEGLMVTISREEFERLEAQAQKTEEYLDHLKRARADLENFKKRIQKERQHLRSSIVRDLIQSFFPIIDNLELALQAADQTGKIEDLVSGLKMIQTQIVQFLQNQGVRPIEALHQPFDPHYHEAVAQEESEEHPPHTVIEEIQKGYVIGDMIVRPSRVKVSAASSQSSSSGEVSELPEDESASSPQAQEDEGSGRSGKEESGSASSECKDLEEG